MIEVSVGARQGGLNISETADFHTQRSLEFGENGAKDKTTAVLRALKMPC